MRLPVLLALVLAACSAPSAPSVAPAPAASTSRTAPTTPPVPSFTSPPSDWQLLDATADGVQGTGARRAVRELLAGRKPARTVVVAVIDGGIDTAHAGLSDRLWLSPREVAGNGRDDDGNGHVDDTRGWNFIGGADGRNVKQETLELTREYARCARAGASASGCAAISAEFTAKREEARMEAAQMEQVSAVYGITLGLLQRALPGDSLTVERVTALVPTTDSVRVAREIYLQLAQSGVTAEQLEKAVTDAKESLAYGLNPEFDPRPIVGDDPANVTERAYGNRDVTGPDASHGTHVAGIIGAVKQGDAGMDGVAGSVRLMAVRAVPNGDERDKDVANAIRYAVDNGAQIINMSFGKGYSPDKRAVDEAAKYAESRGVLLVHAAGNDGEDLAVSRNFPTATYLDGGRAANWIEVGASSWKGGDHLAADFSNYGKAEVDLFAPGVDILSTVPGGGWERNSGTSMAAPVVSGVAALLMSYFPKLSAADVKRILLETATRYPDAMVVRPGRPEEKVRFGDLSATGGVVDAYAAVRAALGKQGNVP
jgi:subtilisin family serine protease